MTIQKQSMAQFNSAVDRRRTVGAYRTPLEITTAADRATFDDKRHKGATHWGAGGNLSHFDRADFAFGGGRTISKNMAHSATAVTATPLDPSWAILILALAGSLTFALLASALGLVSYGV